MSPYLINQLALGWYNDWRKASPRRRQDMVRQAYRMDGGADRLAAMKFLRMTEEAEERGAA